MTVTPPTAKEATGPTTSVTFNVLAFDLVDGARPVTCGQAATCVAATLPAGSYDCTGLFEVGTTLVTCRAADNALVDPTDDTKHNVASTSFKIVIGECRHDIRTL